MDKYTIDLDKVLNDFEYSELTEESNLNTSVSNISNQNQPLHYTEKNFNNALQYPKNNSNSLTTKHSINNVFHSLNEYLNSDIKDFKGPELSEINEIESHVPMFVPKPQTSIQDLFKDSTDSKEFESDLLRRPSSNTTLSYVNSKTTITPPMLNMNSKQSLINSPSTNSEISSVDDSTLANNNPKPDFFHSEPHFSHKNSNSSLETDATPILNHTDSKNFQVETLLDTTNDDNEVNTQNLANLSLHSDDFYPDSNVHKDINDVFDKPRNVVSPSVSIPQKIPESKNLNNENVSESPSSHPTFMRTNTTTSISDVKSNHTFIENDLKTTSGPQKCIMSSSSKNSNLGKDSEAININENQNENNSDVFQTHSFSEDSQNDEISLKRGSVELEEELGAKIVKSSENLDEEKNIYDETNKILPDQTYSDSEEVQNSLETCESKEIKNDLTKNTNLTINKSSNSFEIEVPKSNIEKYDSQLSKESESVIGFDQDFDISDSEMENELQKLENEYKEKISNNIQNENDFETDDNFNVNNVNFVKDHEEVAQTIMIKNDIKSTTDNNSNQPDSSNQQSENIEENTINTEIENSNNLETINEQAQYAANDEHRENFSLQRPNSLDISETSESTNTTINLIGSPGSTPFNNVYVENSLNTDSEITPQEITENTSESPKPEIEEVLSPKPELKTAELNNSLSPTVSEVSTSEASDSPNTSDSCNDTSLDDTLNDSLTKNVPNVTSTLNQNFDETSQGSSGDTRSNVPTNMLGKMAPFWTPDSEAMNCLHCDLKFTVVKRRHHCRACGLVLCSKCCYLKHKLEYMDNQEARVCTKCYEILSGIMGPSESSPSGTQRPVNPGNPMDYCSIVSPLQQVGNLPANPPSVMVPVGVLKRKGAIKPRSNKSVMFCDGIRPGCDLTELDYDFNYKASQTSSSKVAQNVTKPNRNLPKIDPKTSSYIPNEDNCLPPTVNILKSEITYSECANSQSVVEMLKNESLIFALQRNLHIHVKLINMDCCINKQAWCFTTEGMIAVGQDEIIILLEVIENEKTVPKDIFLHLNHIYNEAVKGTSITELGLSIHNTSNFLESKNHAGFLYIKPTFQCTQNLIIPKEPYLVGVLIHRWETPWAKIFPLRLLLRLGAEYRYYPSPIISTRHRESVYVEIGHTIINLLADFRNFSYTLPNVRGLTIHMTEKNTTVSIPQNRYDQVMKALNNSSDHILAFSANFSPDADSHLVCIQDTHGNNENSYTTHAINIQNKPRKVTGASFIVLNGALKSSSGLTAKSSIVEDGLMIQILPEQMVKLRSSLRNMKDFKINCGCVNAQSDEFVNIVWTENDVNFNVGVISPIDNLTLNGVPSIRVHNGKDYVCNSGNKMIRWTEVFIIQSGDENNRTQDPVDISKISESISKATCQALVKYLDLLATNSFLKLGIRTNLHMESVSYLAGSNGVKLPPIYMKSLDNELIPVLHKITSNNLGENAMVIELIFHILNM